MPPRRGDLTEPGQLGQALDETAHPVGVPHDQLLRLLASFQAHLRLLHQEFGEALQRREGSSQFMAGVRQEVAQPLLRRLGATQRGAQPVEHRVQGTAEVADLGDRMPVRNAQFQLTFCDAPGSALDSDQRPQSQPHSEGAEEDDPRCDGHPDSEAEPQHPGGRLVHLLQRQRHHDPGAVGAGPGDHPPGAAAVGRGDRGGAAVLDAEFRLRLRESRPGTAPVAAQRHGIPVAASVVEVHPVVRREAARPAGRP